MNAKENAEYLINKMNNVDLNCKNESMCMLYPHAVECALICIDEIIEIVKPRLTEITIDYIYWNNVKEEILTIKNK
jgi:hypothetical protein